jgi:hypothetical protein
VGEFVALSATSYAAPTAPFGSSPLFIVMTGTAPADALIVML